jgi:hypothetical protein
MQWGRSQLHAEVPNRHGGQAGHASGKGEAAARALPSGLSGHGRHVVRKGVLQIPALRQLLLRALPELHSQAHVIVM